MEAGIWVYPWDLLDEGARPVAARLDALGYSSIHLAAAYHSVHAVLPHNPRRRTFTADEAAVYYRPSVEVWRDAPMRPSVSPIVDARGDALAEAHRACRDLGLDLVAWTVGAHNGELGRRYPSVNVVDLFGDAQVGSVCPANPDVIDYLVRLVTDLRSRCDAIELEAFHWLPFQHHHHSKAGVRLRAAARLLLSLCLCVHCSSLGTQAGVDMPELAARLRLQVDGLLSMETVADDDAQIGELIDRDPQLNEFLQARASAMDRLVRRVVEASAPRPVHLIVLGPPWITAVDPGTVWTQVDRVVVPAYGSPGEIDAIAGAAIRQVAHLDGLTIGLSLLEPETHDRATFSEVCRSVANLGISRTVLYNYGLADARRLEWVTSVLDVGARKQSQASGGS